MASASASPSRSDRRSAAASRRPATAPRPCTNSSLKRRSTSRASCEPRTAFDGVVAAVAIDTLKVARRLREVGFSEPQAEAVVAAVQEATISGDLATKADVGAVRTELAEVRAELKAEIAELRSELRQSELRLEAKLEAIKADILNR